MKSLKLKHGLFPAEITLPGSKSYANRVLILAALKPSPFTIYDLPESTDVTILASCLREIGLRVVFRDSDCVVEGCFPDCEKEEGAEIFVGEGGTTARFLAALVLRGSRPYTLILGERLKERPWQEFIELVRQLGGKAELDGNSLRLQGPLSPPEKLEVDCSRTTQFATGLQLAFGNTTEIVPVNLQSSQSYWEMTKLLHQKLSTTDSFHVPLDWSSASYPLAFAALNQDIFFPRLKIDRFQADSKFADLLMECGHYHEREGGILIRPLGVKKNITMDMSDALDLVPAMGYFLGHVEGRHCLKNIENLIHKESDRLEEVIKLLKVFGRTAETKGKDLWIEGKIERVLVEKDLRFPDDHRMVMTGALFLLHHSGGTLGPSSAVNKSYPRFFEILEGNILP